MRRDKVVGICFDSNEIWDNRNDETNNVRGLKHLVYGSLNYQSMSPSTTSISDLQLLGYDAFSF